MRKNLEKNAPGLFWQEKTQMCKFLERKQTFTNGR
jgi:hypothetical protein